MEFEIQGSELREAIKLARQFSRQGANLPLLAKSIIFAHAGGGVKMMATRDIGTFCHVLETRNYRNPGGHNWAIDSVAADSVRKTLKDVTYTVRAEYGQNRVQFIEGERVITTFTARPTRTLPVVPAFQHDVRITNPTDFFNSLIMGAQLAMKAKDGGPYSFLYIDFGRKEICASDSRECLSDSVSVNTDNFPHTAEFGINPWSARLMKTIGAIGDPTEIKLAISEGNLIILNGRTAGIFKGTGLSDFPDWRFLSVGDHSLSVSPEVIHDLIDQAMCSSVRSVRIENLDTGVWSTAGLCEGRVFTGSAYKNRIADPSEPGGDFSMDVASLLEAVNAFKAEKEVKIEFGPDSGTVKFSGSHRKLFILPLSVRETRTNLDIPAPLSINMDNTREENTGSVSARVLTPGDVIERGTERFVVKWVALDLDLIKMEMLGGRLQRTGKYRMARVSTLDTKDMFRKSIGGISLGTV